MFYQAKIIRKITFGLFLGLFWEGGFFIWNKFE